MSNVKLVQSDFERVERLLKAMAAELGADVRIAISRTGLHLFWVGFDNEYDYGGDTLEEAYTSALKSEDWQKIIHDQQEQATYSNWCEVMEDEGWHVVFSGNSDQTIWQHETAVTADGTPRTLTHEAAKPFIKAGQTPAPF